LKQTYPTLRKLGVNRTKILMKQKYWSVSPSCEQYSLMKNHLHISRSILLC